MTAIALDNKARALGKDYLQTEGQMLEVLMEMRAVRAFVELDFSGVYDYCKRALRLSNAQAFYFKSVAEKAEEVPAIKTAILQGDITLSQARRIVPAINESNQAEWIQKAKTLPQEELERQVTIVNPKSRIKDKMKPVAPELSELKVGVNKDTEGDLNALKDILSQKLGRAASLSDVVAWMAKECRKKFDLTQAKIISLGNRPPQVGRHAVKISLKKAVYRRDGGRCVHVGHDGKRCEQRRWLHLHHKVEVVRGGLNTLGNLELLCHGHHQGRHALAS